MCQAESLGLDIVQADLAKDQAIEASTYEISTLRRHLCHVMHQLVQAENAKDEAIEDFNAKMDTIQEYEGIINALNKENNQLKAQLCVMAQDQENQDEKVEKLEIKLESLTKQHQETVEALDSKVVIIQENESRIKALNTENNELRMKEVMEDVIA